MESRDVGIGNVRSVGEVDNQRRGASGARRVGAVASKEGRPGVETLVNEGVLVRDGGECGAIGNARGVQAALVGGNQSGTVRPGVVGVSRGINGEDNIDVSLGLDQWVQRDVLEILATIHDVQLFLLGVRRFRVAPLVKWVG